MDLDRLRELDAADPLAGFRARFDLPEDLAYLAGHSLGPPPRDAAARVQALIGDWRSELVEAWTTSGWLDAPGRIGAKAARLMGARAGEVTVSDSTTVNLFKLLAAVLRATDRPGEVLTVEGEFPTDLYAAKAACDLHGRRLCKVTPDDLLQAIGQGPVLVVLSHAHYLGGEVRDMAAINAAAQAAGAFVLWDISHSLGVFPIDLEGAGADLAVGCGYKHLCGGPGAPSLLYVAERHQDRLASPIAGWFGHARPFDFAPDYVPAEGVRRFLAGTPPMLSLAALECGVDLALEADLTAAQAKVQAMAAALIGLMAEARPDLAPLGPAPGQPRAGHVAFRCRGAPALQRALLERRIVCDARGEEVLRLSVSPLHVRFEDLGRAVGALGTL